MYKKLIVAVDFSDSSQKIMERAKELVKADIDKLHVVHVVESVPVVWGAHSYAIDPIDLQKKILDGARATMLQFAEKFDIRKEQQHVLQGKPATKIRELQDEIDADAIVIGSHGHSGWKIVLGSTATSLLHGAKVDVLTVYVSDD